MRNTSSDKDYFHRSTSIRSDFVRTMSRSEKILFFSFVDGGDGFSIDCPQEERSFLVRVARFSTNHLFDSTSRFFGV